MASNPLSFSRQSRLLTPEQFSSALRARPIGRSNLLVCHWCEEPNPESAEALTPKLGLIIPKRLVRLSVCRNAIKRVLRESFRHRQPNLPGGYYVFRFKAPVPTGSLTMLKRAVRQQADWLLTRVSSKK